MDTYEDYADRHCNGEWDVNTLKRTVKNLITEDKDVQYWLADKRVNKLNREIRNYKVSTYNTIEDVVVKYMSCEHPEAEDLNIDDILYAACVACSDDDETLQPLDRTNLKEVAAHKYAILFNTDNFKYAVVETSKQKALKTKTLTGRLSESRDENAKYIDIDDVQNILSGSSAFNVFYAPDVPRYGNSKYNKLEEDYLDFMIKSVFDMPFSKQNYTEADYSLIYDGIKKVAATNKMSVSKYIERINPENKFNIRCGDAIVVDLFDNILKNA